VTLRLSKDAPHALAIRSPLPGRRGAAGELVDGIPNKRTITAEVRRRMSLSAVISLLFLIIILVILLLIANADSKPQEPVQTPTGIILASKACPPTTCSLACSSRPNLQT
jgi:hypothetical protein